MLPPRERDKLRSLLHDDPVQMKRRVASLRLHGWTVREIAIALDRAPATIQYWSQSRPLDDETDITPSRRRPTGTQIKRRPVEVPPEILNYLRSLTKSARRVNRHTEPNSKDAQASKELTFILGILVLERMVPLRYLARELDISASAISQRIKEGQRLNWLPMPSSGATPPED